MSVCVSDMQIRTGMYGRGASINSMKVVILAGGKGSRISEESVLKPKPMVDIGDKPILWQDRKSVV